MIRTVEFTPKSVTQSIGTNGVISSGEVDLTIELSLTPDEAQEFIAWVHKARFNTSRADRAVWLLWQSDRTG